VSGPAGPPAAAQAELERLIGRLVESGELGLQACAVVDGAVVVDAAGGFTSPARDRPIDGDSLFPVFSVTKGIVAAALLALLSGGALELDGAVASYWPEFGRGGKRAITVADVLVHAAGVPQMPADVDVEEMCDWDRMASLIASLEPLWPPGERCGYHAYTFGWIAGELLRAASQQAGTAGEIVRRLVCEPACASDFWIGAPAAVHGRIVDVLREPGTPAAGRELLARAIPPRLAPGPEVYGQPLVRSACLPAAGGIGTARSIATIYSLLACDPERAGIDGAWTARLGRPQRDEHDCVLGTAIARSLGFYVAPRASTPLAAPFDGATAVFGHPGAGGSLGWAEPDAGAGFAITRSRMTAAAWGDPHVQELVAALRAAVARRP
jgi:CubicO group peptidase (beta-lactamase class C family)